MPESFDTWYSEKWLKWEMIYLLVVSWWCIQYVPTAPPATRCWCLLSPFIFLFIIYYCDFLGSWNPLMKLNTSIRPPEEAEIQNISKKRVEDYCGSYMLISIYIHLDIFIRYVNIRGGTYGTIFCTFLCSHACMLFYNLPINLYFLL